MKKIFLAIITLTLISFNTCDDNPVNGDNVIPGRRDYTWTVDTLAGLNSPRYRMWGSSPSDVWATTSSNWDVSISHFNGSEWISYGVPGIIQPKAIFGFSSNSIFLGDENGKIWRFDAGGWKLFAELKKEGTDFIMFENIWGNSPNDFFAVGNGPDENLYANVSVIAHYINNKWVMQNTDALTGDVVHLYKNKLDNKIYFRLTKIGGIVHVDSTIIYEYANEKYYRVYSSTETKGFQSDISLISDEVYFIIGNEIAKRKNNQFQTLLKVDNHNFYQRIWGRNSKDIFLLMTDGLAHYNGSDIEYLFHFTFGQATPWTQIYGAALFENEVFFLVDEPPTGLSLVYHGILK
jgi:hypothetical protein